MKNERAQLLGLCVCARQHSVHGHVVLGAHMRVTLLSASVKELAVKRRDALRMER